MSCDSPFTHRTKFTWCIAVCALLLTGLAHAGIVSTTHPLERNGVRLFLQQHHEEQEGQQSPHILLVHGLTYSSHEFDVPFEDYSLVRVLANHHYHVWTLDITGYGGSGLPINGFIPDSDYAARDVAAAVSEILKFAGVETIDLLGWSWGTVTAARMAEMYPQWIDRLVLYAPLHRGLGGPPPTTDWHVNTWDHAAEDFQKLPNGAIDYSIVPPEVAAAYLSNCWRYDGNRSPNGGRRDLSQHSDVRLFHEEKLSMPVLLIGGSHDPYMDWKDLAVMFQHLPQKEHSSVVKINGASHVMMLEKPYYRRFQEEVLLFLGR